MDPSVLKLIIDEFNQRFDEMEARWDPCFSPLPAKDPQVAVEELRIGTITSTPSVPYAPIGSTTTASTDEPSPCPVAVRTNSATADDSVLSFMTAHASSLSGEEFEFGTGNDSDLLRNRPFGLAFAPSQSSTPVLAF
jgi:hypothetical protein